MPLISFCCCRPLHYCPQDGMRSVRTFNRSCTDLQLVKLREMNWRRWWVNMQLLVQLCCHILTRLNTKPRSGRAKLGLGGVVDMSGFGSSGMANRARATAPTNAPDGTHLARSPCHIHLYCASSRDSHWTHNSLDNASVQSQPLSGAWTIFLPNPLAPNSASVGRVGRPPPAMLGVCHATSFPQCLQCPT